MAQSHPTLERLDDQIAWYDRKSLANERWYKGLKVGTLVTGAIIPFAAGVGAPAWLTGGLGGLIVVLEGLQSLNQYQHNWITYRSTCEELKHEKYLWQAKAGPYATAEHPDVLLAERVEALTSREHAKWVSTREQLEQQPRHSRG